MYNFNIVFIMVLVSRQVSGGGVRVNGIENGIGRERNSHDFVGRSTRRNRKRKSIPRAFGHVALERSRNRLGKE